uniref:Ribosomal protein L21 n=1 Tax=Pseudictyota dubia TaxID=2749911 RepID=A0A7R9WBB8_9STRA|mmetsp:Transcript_4257/g.7452  ORF Transcript_4257/g.7452 Transcript_4257/m.7452 type:complete len:168 (+) Transcript_4257:44-547(+)|eukprot:TRINITY_DN12847_c0_g7_i1.p2 TRINITY_DN12847_c0_g7~~TRINITY_DN12847_c0_g7_i1.p2  ORF type:complete len:168 (-),score=30.70 TRINITY_DN12847_c0_g7_i1:260-763(-)
MPHSFGYRARTRDMFSRGFRKSGLHGFGVTVTNASFKLGDYVDIVPNPAQQKGLPHRFYTGRTGIVFNVSRRAVGVEINKLVREKILRKRINVRIEHVRKSKCRQDFLDRVKRNDQLKRDAKAAGTRVPVRQLKRMPKGPKEGRIIKAKAKAGYPIVMRPKAFDEWL